MSQRLLYQNKYSENRKMLIIGVPFINGLGKTKGCEKIPDILIKNAVKIKVDNDNVKDSLEKIYKESFQILKKHKKVIFIGGDHSISYPLAKAFAEISKKSKKKCLVVFDAHADCMKPMKEPTHEEWLRAILEEKLFDKVILIGLRKIELEEEKFLKRRKEVKILKKNEKLNFNLNLLDYEIYLSIDIDVFDPSIAPGTSYLEKNGINFKEFSNLIKKIKDKAKAIDLVEVNPEKDLNNKTLNLALNMIKILK